MPINWVILYFHLLETEIIVWKCITHFELIRNRDNIYGIKLLDRHRLSVTSNVCYVYWRQDVRKKSLPMWLLMKPGRRAVTPDNKHADSITGNLKVSRINSVTYLHDGLASFSLAALPRPPRVLLSVSTVSYLNLFKLAFRMWKLRCYEIALFGTQPPTPIWVKPIVLLRSMAIGRNISCVLFYTLLVTRFS